MIDAVTMVKIDNNEVLPKFKNYHYDHNVDIIQNTLNNISNHHYVYRIDNDLNMWELFGIGNIRQYLILNNKVKRQDKMRRREDVYRFNLFRLLNNYI